MGAAKLWQAAVGYATGGGGGEADKKKKKSTNERSCLENMSVVGKIGLDLKIRTIISFIPLRNCESSQVASQFWNLRNALCMTDPQKQKQK